VTETREETVTWLTQEAYDRLKAELDHLSGPGRIEIAKKIEAAREEGDLRENGGYHAAKDEQGQIEGRIRQLQYILENARVGDPPRTEGVVGPGMTVTVRFAGDEDEVVRPPAQLVDEIGDQIVEPAGFADQADQRLARDGFLGGEDGGFDPQHPFAPAGGGGDFLPLSGGNLTGDINMIGTTGPTVMAKLNLFVRGASLAWSETDNAIVFTKGTGNYPLVVRANDGTNPQPILDQTQGDARYLQLTQVDSLRAKPVVYNVPADIVIPGSGDWTQIANIPCTLPPRPGVTSMLMVSVNCNLKGVNNVAGIGARVPISPTPEQRIFGFGGTVTDPSAGFSVNFFVTPAAGVTTLNVAVQLNAFPITGGAPVSYTVAGGNVLVLDRSQIVIVDLGPL